MSVQAILMPLLVQVALTFVLGFWAATVRFGAVRSGATRPRDVTLREPNWPPRVLQFTYAFQNQLELPLLFYVLTVLALVTRQADVLFVVMAWLFVILRVLHAYVHVTSNQLRRRFVLFLSGALMLALMWVIYVVRLMAS
jgi:hypothetical protein